MIPERLSLSVVLSRVRFYAREKLIYQSLVRLTRASRRNLFLPEI